MKNKFIAYLHSCGLSQNELTEIFLVENSAEEFYESLNNDSLGKIIKNSSRREKVLENYRKLKTVYIDGVIEKLGVDIITVHDEGYPESLKNIPHTPYVLYIRGKLPDQEMFGVVGARKITDYGKSVISRIIPDISKVFPIVSGGAAGCDTFAHKACMETGNPTVVVVGTGIDQTYPVSNEKLFNSVVGDGGAIVSIFRIGEPGNPYNFPVRNEIVVGLSKGILVVEAQEKSGSLITAGLALDLGKDLFSVPGNITSLQSAGTNKLIVKGEAKTVVSSHDVLEEYNMQVKKQSHRDILPVLDGEEKKIYDLLSQEASDIDKISLELGLEAYKITPKVSMLELKGLIKKNLMGKYELS